MPGPKHNNEKRTAGPRPDPNGNPRKANRKIAKRLAARIAGFSKSNDKYAGGFHVAGSQNRKK